MIKSIFNFFRSRHSVPKTMPGKYDELAIYNSEKRRGIVHEASKNERMEKLQREFDIEYFLIPKNENAHRRTH